MNALKKLITLKPNLKTNSGNKKTDVDKESNTYFKNGYNNAIDSSGSSKTLKTCLVEVFESFKEETRRKIEQQDELKKPIKEEHQRKTSELNMRQVLKDLKTKQINEIENDIKRINNDISEVAENPQKYGIDADKKPKAQFYIGLLILLPITLYLLVFYISASYSAFFKQFDPSTTVFAAIFDGQALTKAYYDPNGGLLEVIFICTIPFAFMGLGYLIHMFQKSKGSAFFKIFALFLITFIFDAILAYQIENKIFEFNKLPGEVFSLEKAIQSVDFWGIIFAGFVVYVIWGLVFDFIMKEYENIDKIKVFIRSLKDQKNNLNNEKQELLKLIQSIDNEISKIKGEINELQAKIDGFIFEKKRYLIYHSQYLKGWLLAIGKEIALPNEKKDNLIEKCNEVSDEHLKKYKVDDNDFENIIYS